MKKEMATHSSVLAWRIPGMVEPGGLPSMGSHRVGHNWSNLAAAAAVPLKSYKMHLIILAKYCLPGKLNKDSVSTVFYWGLITYASTRYAAKFQTQEKKKKKADVQDKAHCLNSLGVVSWLFLSGNGGNTSPYPSSQILANLPCYQAFLRMVVFNSCLHSNSIWSGLLQSLYFKNGDFI